MYVPKMMVGLGIGVALGFGAVGTSFAASMINSSAPVGCASVPGPSAQPVGCASRPGNGYGDKNHVHTGPAAACPPGLAVAAAHLAPVGCASRPGNGYGDKNHVHTGAPKSPAQAGAHRTSPKGGAAKGHPAGAVGRSSNGHASSTHRPAGPAAAQGRVSYAPTASAPATRGNSGSAHGPGAPHGNSGH